MHHRFDDTQILLQEKLAFKKNDFKAAKVDKSHFPGCFFIRYCMLLAPQLGLSLLALDNIISCCAKKRQAPISLALIYHSYFCHVIHFPQFSHHQFPICTVVGVTTDPHKLLPFT